jgi:N-acetylglucosamine-6-phosphate deacetylase
LADGSGTICGSCASLLDAFVALVNVFSLPLASASALVSANPARLVGLDCGVLHVGGYADMVLLTAAPALAWHATIVRGHIVREP